MPEHESTINAPDNRIPQVTIKKILSNMGYRTRNLKNNFTKTNVGLHNIRIFVKEYSFENNISIDSPESIVKICINIQYLRQGELKPGIRIPNILSGGSRYFDS